MKIQIKKIIFLFLGFFSAYAQDIPRRALDYRYGDWITYTDLRHVTSVAYGDEYVYFGTASGIAKYSHAMRRWEMPVTYSSGLPEDDIEIVHFDRESGTLWCASGDFLNFFLSGANGWRSINLDEMPFSRILAIGSGASQLWLHTEAGLFSGNRMGGPFYRGMESGAANDNIRWSGQEGRIATFPELFPRGNYFWFPDPGMIEDMYARKYYITDHFFDPFHRLWLGTDGKGAAFADVRMNSLVFLPFGLVVEKVFSMAWDQDGMWIGGVPQKGNDGGITYWDMNQNDWHYYERTAVPSMRTDHVFCILPDETFVWFGTDEGLLRYERKKRIWTHYRVQQNLWSNQINHLVLSDTTLWIATETGLNAMDLNTGKINQVRYAPLVHRHIFQLEKDEYGIWVCAENGLFHYEFESGIWGAIPHADGIHPVRFTAISAHKDEIWAGTDDGIQMYDPAAGEWIAFPPEHYPVHARYFSVLVDDDAVWFGTDRGLLKYLKSEKRWRWFTEEDGLRHSSIYWILLDGDALWLGTGGGLTRFIWDAPYRQD